MNRTVLRLAVVLAASLMLFALATPGRARALPGPAYFSTGLVDDLAFQSTDSAFRSLWFGRAQQVGATSVRIGVGWNAIAPFTLPRGFQASNPSDPHYQWSALDATVRDATAHGQSVVLLVGHAPTWAEGANIPSYVMPGAWEPSPEALAQFGHAIALRYSGHFPDPLNPLSTLPRVRYFQAWNEPNLARYLLPQWVRSSTGAIVAFSPGLYRSLLNAFYTAVKAVQPDSVVLAAGTAPYGEAPGVADMMPLAFLRGVLCLSSSLHALPCPDPPHFDALDHHPYAIAPTVPARVYDNISVPDLGKIWRVLHAAQRVGHALPRGSKSLWVTELGWSTNPPNALTAARQARYLSEGFYELWTQSISHAYWFQLRDPVGKTNSFATAGLYFGDGTPKLSATAYRFPFVAVPVRHNKRAVILWGKAPSSGPVEIDKLKGVTWRRVLSLRTSPGGIFYAYARLGQTGQFRAVSGASVSVPWVNS